MSDRLREARDRLRAVYNQPWGKVSQRELDDAAFAALEAMDKWLALTETGPDYEAAAKVIYLAGEGNEQGWKTINTVDDPIFRKTVDHLRFFGETPDE